MKYSSILLGAVVLAAGSAHASDFKPNGSIGLTQTFYGNAGSYKNSTSHPSLVMNYQFLPKWSLSLEWDRTWNLYSYNGGLKQQNNDYSQPAATLYYNYGNIGASKVNWSSSLKLETQSEFVHNSQAYLMAQTVFDFSKYLPQNEYVQISQFALAPMYIRGKNISGPSGHVDTYGIGLLTTWNLPANFSLTLNAYTFRDSYSGTFIISDGNTNYRNANYFMLTAWLEYSKTLYKFDQNTSLAFNFAGGLDPYISSNRRAAWDPFLAGNDMYEWLSPTVMEGNYKRTYDLFALPGLTLTYNFDKNFTATAFVQVKYSNQVWGQTEKDWRFQPQAGFSLTYTF